MTDDMWIKPDNDELAYKDPERGPSTIIFHWCPHDGVQGVCFDKGDAHYEQDASMLGDHCEEASCDDPRQRYGWHVIEGFEMDYTRDYYGECEGRAEWVKVRRATWRDFNMLWWGGDGPWFVALMARTPWHMPDWWPEP